MQGNELLGIRQLALLHQSVSTFGLTALDKLLCFMLVSVIQKWLTSFRLMIVRPPLTRPVALRVVAEGPFAGSTTRARRTGSPRGSSR